MLVSDYNGNVYTVDENSYIYHANYKRASQNIIRIGYPTGYTFS